MIFYGFTQFHLLIDIRQNIEKLATWWLHGENRTKRKIWLDLEVMLSLTMRKPMN
jgi:hypothetical protein